MSAKKLRKEWPFLWFCIMVVSSKLTSLAWYLPYRNQISDTIGSLRTNYKLQSKPFITESIRRAISLVFGLGLTKQIPKDKPTKLCEIGRSLYEQWRKKTVVLGCFLITSVYVWSSIYANRELIIQSIMIWMENWRTLLENTSRWVYSYFEWKERVFQRWDLDPTSTITNGYWENGSEHIVWQRNAFDSAKKASRKHVYTVGGG